MNLFLLMDDNQNTESTAEEQPGAVQQHFDEKLSFKRLRMPLQLNHSQLNSKRRFPIMG
ncbi:MAG: hypothetical protein WKF59_20110 [Chitinophagaceae bacterium]